jgi:hypothetical protein
MNASKPNTPAKQMLAFLRADPRFARYRFIPNSIARTGNLDRPTLRIVHSDRQPSTHAAGFWLDELRLVLYVPGIAESTEDDLDSELVTLGDLLEDTPSINFVRAERTTTDEFNTWTCTVEIHTQKVS